MIRILIFIIVSAAALSMAYVLGKGEDRKKRMIWLGGGAFAAAFALFMQGSFSLYFSLLAIVGISLVGALVYAKYLEKEQMKNQQRLQERKNRRSRTQIQPEEPAKNLIHEPIADKPFGMQTIAVIREEQKVE